MNDDPGRDGATPDPTPPDGVASDAAAQRGLGASTHAGAPRRTVRTASLAFGIVVVGLIALFVVTSRSGDDSDDSSTLVGKQAPALSGLTATGSEVSIDEFRGRWVVVNFFATWCPPCVREHPELVAFNEWAVDAGDAVVVSVAYQEQPEKIIEFFEDNGGDWPVIVEGANTPTLEFGVRALPESFLVDPDGVVAEKFTGGVTANELIDAIADAGSDG